MKVIHRYIMPALLGITLASCSEPFPDLISPELAEKYDQTTMTYYSPSMIAASGLLDTTGELAGFLDGLHDIIILKSTTDEKDSTVYPTALSIAEDIDALELTPVVPSMYRSQSSIQIFGKSTADDQLTYLLIVIHNDPEIQLVEIRGDQLRQKLMGLVLRALKNPSSINLPFLE